MKIPVPQLITRLFLLLLAGILMPATTDALTRAPAGNVTAVTDARGFTTATDLDFLEKLKNPKDLARLLCKGSFETLFAALGGGLAKKLLQFVNEMGIMCRFAAGVESGLAKVGVDMSKMTRHLCFAAGTLVALGDGGSAPIETIKAGWRVATPDAEATHTEVDPAIWKRSR